MEQYETEHIYLQHLRQMKVGPGVGAERITKALFIGLAIAAGFAFIQLITPSIFRPVMAIPVVLVAIFVLIISPPAILLYLVDSVPSTFKHDHDSGFIKEIFLSPLTSREIINDVRIYFTQIILKLYAMPLCIPLLFLLVPDFRNLPGLPVNFSTFTAFIANNLALLSSCWLLLELGLLYNSSPHKPYKAALTLVFITIPLFSAILLLGWILTSAIHPVLVNLSFIDIPGEPWVYTSLRSITFAGLFLISASIVFYLSPGFLDTYRRNYLS